MLPYKFIFYDSFQQPILPLFPFFLFSLLFPFPFSFPTTRGLVEEAVVFPDIRLAFLAFLPTSPSQRPPPTKSTSLLESIVSKEIFADPPNWIYTNIVTLRGVLGELARQSLAHYGLSVPASFRCSVVSTAATLLYSGEFCAIENPLSLTLSIASTATFAWW